MLPSPPPSTRFARHLWGWLAGMTPLLALAADPAAEPPCLPLWPAGQVPGEPAAAPPPRIVERSQDPARPDRYIENVTAPCMAVYRPERPNGIGLLVIPGGGYQRVVLDKEGSALVPPLVEQGQLTLFVLRYRLPSPQRSDREAALADAQRALRTIRTQAPSWGLDPHRIGVMGFSAGGHVAARLAIDHARTVYPADGGVDRVPARPDFQLLIYPVIDMAGADTHTGSRDRLLGETPTAALRAHYSLQHRVHAGVPPTFLLHAGNDTAVPVGNSLLFYRALANHGIATQLHVFPSGGHGFGIHGAQGQPLAAWPRLALEWIRTQPSGHSDD